MASADFCAAIGSPRGSPSPESGTRHRPPEVSLTAFPAHPPDLQPEPSMDGGLRRLLPARPTRTAYYPIPVRQVAVLLHASFRRPLARTPLHFASPSPPSSWTRDFHPQAVEHARHIQEKPLPSGSGFSRFRSSLPRICWGFRRPCAVAAKRDRFRKIQVATKSPRCQALAQARRSSQTSSLLAPH